MSSVRQQIKRLHPSGYSALTSEQAELAWRPGPGGSEAAPDLAHATVVASFVHLTDTHVIDASSPARAEHTQLLETDPKWAVMLAMHRPYELLANHALAMMAETIRRSPQGQVAHAPFEAVLLTGDCTDNAQRNELDAYLSILLGGTFCFPYDGVQSAQAKETGFWCPEPGVNDRWKQDYGYPTVPGLLDAISQPVTSAGTGLPVVAVIGNHDVMRQGTALTSPACEQWATGHLKATSMPPGFDPVDPLAAYLDDPASYLDGAPTRAIRSDAGRRIVLPAEWVAVHQSVGAGFSTGVDYVHDLDQVRIVVLDTNHPFGHYQGSVGRAQLVWLNERIAETDKWVVLATHHGSRSLDNVTAPSATFLASLDPSRPDHEHSVDMAIAEREHAGAIMEVLHRHDRVVAWLSGHRHISSVTHHPHPDGRTEGFWEIVTCSTIDWPSQARSVEILRAAEGSLILASAPIDHAGDLVPGPDAVGSLAGLAGLHRELAANLVGPWGTPKLRRLQGRPEDSACVVALRSAR